MNSNEAEMSILRAPSVKISQNLKNPVKRNRVGKTSLVNESNQMMSLFLNGKYEECLQVCAVANSIDEIQKKIVVAGCWTHLGVHHHQAVEKLNEVISVAPNNSFAHYGLGLNFYLRGELEKCLQPFTIAFGLNKVSMKRAQLYKNCAVRVLKLTNDGENIE